MEIAHQNRRPQTSGILSSLGAIALLGALASGCELGATSDTDGTQPGIRTMLLRHSDDHASNPPAPVAPAGAHLEYHGGNVITNARVAQVLYGSGSYIPEMTATSGLTMASAY